MRISSISPNYYNVNFDKNKPNTGTRKRYQKIKQKNRRVGTTKRRIRKITRRCY